MFLTDGGSCQRVERVHVSLGAVEFACFYKAGDGWMQARKGEGRSPRRPLSLANFLDLKFDLALLLDFFESRAVDCVPLGAHRSPLLL